MQCIIFVSCQNTIFALTFTLVAQSEQRIKWTRKSINIAKSSNN